MRSEYGSEVLVSDLSEQGHAVGVFHPGYVKTDMTQGRGYISPDEAAGMLVTQFSRLSMETTGLFFHANGDALPVTIR